MEVFKNLADEESGLKYWSEATLCRYLELPEAIHCGSVVHQMVANLAAFPFLNQAPAILTKEALLRVVTIMTERYRGILKRGNKDRIRLLFRSLAVFDRRSSAATGGDRPEMSPVDPEESAIVEGVKGFDIDQPANDDLDDEDDDDLAMAALDSLDAIDAIGLGERRQVQHSIIPTDNFLHLVQLLLLIAPVTAQEKLGSYWQLVLEPQQMEDLRRCANSVVAAFGIEDQPGIQYRSFKSVVPNSMTHLFDAFSPLFEHFLFNKDFDLSKRKRRPSTTHEDSVPPTSPINSPSKENEHPTATRQVILQEAGEILTYFKLTQLSFFIPPSTLFGRLHPLFSGSKHGFSLGSFESQVFTWAAPTLLLVSGFILPSDPTDSRERTFADSLPPRRLSSSTTPGKRVTYGAYIPSQWKQTHRTCFGDESTMLFQLDPVHDVFRASSVSQNYISYVTPTTSNVHPGINFGTAVPAKATHSQEAVPLGPISLYLDSALEFGVFTHIAGGGGSFHPSVSPARSGPSKARSTSVTEARRRRSGSLLDSSQGSGKGYWQDRFEIESLEVWGFGGEKEAEKKRKAMEFEEREARLRRDGGVKTGDHEQDKEILRMAGLYGYGESGGSMG